MSTNAPQQRLRSLLTYPFVALILIPALIIALSSLYTGLKAVDSLSERVITDVSSRVEQAAVHQLDEAAVTLRSTVPGVADAHGSAAALFSDLGEIEKKLFELSSGARTTSYFFYGGADGTFIGVDRHRVGSRAAATVRLKTDRQSPRKIYSARTPGDRGRLIETETRTFDVLARPWFAAASQSKRLTWTPVYVSFASGALVTTASQPLFSATGSLMGVLAADVELSELSEFMKTVSVSKSGVAFIVDEQGSLVASSTLGLPYKATAGGQQRLRVRESSDPVERAAAAWWEAQARGKTLASAEASSSLTSNALSMISAKVNDPDSGAIDVASRRIRGLDGVAWDIVVAIPRSDLTAPIVQSTALMFAVIVAALAAALQLGLWIVRRVTRDVDLLVDAANKYSSTQDAFVKPETSLEETSVLGAAFERMFQRLSDSSTIIRKQNEDLAALNANLEERVERRTRQLESKNFDLTHEITRREVLERELRLANETATVQSQNKARFMAMLSHELRTPLQAVIGQSQLLMSKSSVAPDEARMLDATSKSLLTLIDSVLSHTFVETGRIDAKAREFELKPAIEGAVAVACAANEVPVDTVTIDVAANVPAFVITDDGVLRQLISNLVANAFKHAPKARVFIRVTRLPAEQSDPPLSVLKLDQPFKLLVQVSDNGPGVSEWARPTLFQAPLSAISAEHAPGATRGLGLSICALMARSLGGTIRYVELPSAGATFEFSVEAAAGASGVNSAGRHEATAPHDIAHAGLRCLVVDDHELNLRLVSEMLKLLGHTVQGVTSGEAAVNAAHDALYVANTVAATSPFDVIFMDLNLPGISGVEAIDAIKALYVRAAVQMPRFVVLTASNRVELDRFGATASHLAYLSKPATLSTLARVLAETPLPDSSAPPNASNAALDLLKPVVLSQLLEMDRRSQHPFLRPLVEEYAASLPKEWANLRSVMERGDTVNVRHLSHAMIGGAEQVGAQRLAKLLRAVHDETHQNDLIPELSVAVTDTAQALISWIKFNYA